MSKTERIAAALASYGWPPIMPMPVATRYACCSRWTIQRAIKSGALHIAGKRGRSLTFRREDLERWMLGDPGLPQSDPQPPRGLRRLDARSGDALTRIAETASRGRAA